mmetsp:Transcript_15283/g.25850  ORF Transcript_15283/g.25850 Transcript_15283/m.25850 type:complete len:154 (+) Transcript_15283:357-818(+)
MTVQQENQMSLQQKIFTNLLQDSLLDNQYCVDCGWKLVAGALIPPSQINNYQLNQSQRVQRDLAINQQFKSIFVSVNHGTFLCHNCAAIHQTHYGSEISFIKTIVNDKVISEGERVAGSPHQFRVIKLSRWTYTQLRVLINSGGNKAFRDYME